jgi:flagella basal body P-ring formation protein FlgA
MLLRPFTALLLFLASTIAAASSADLARGARVFLEQQVLPGGGEVEVVIGEVDSRLTLGACARYEPFVPAGAKLWGRSSLGVRCVDGANWTVFVPIEVRVWAPVQVAARPIARGRPVTDDDVRIDRVDLTRVSGAIYGADDSFDGNVAVRAIAAGEPLRRDLLKPPPIMAAGDPVKVIYDGNGFAISIDGKALAPAGDGQTVRVATAAGRILTGVARAGHIVRVK